MILWRLLALYGALGHLPSEGPTGLGAGHDRAVPAYERLQERAGGLWCPPPLSEILSCLSGTP